MDVVSARRPTIRAHQEHVDQFGRPFTHPLRVSEHTSLRHDDRLVAAGLLHDVVEKGGFTWGQVGDAGADDELLTVLDAQTDGRTNPKLRVARHPPPRCSKGIDRLD